MTTSWIQRYAMFTVVGAVGVMAVALPACGDDSGMTCPTGTTECDGICANTSSDPEHCGECGTVCGADELCDDGTCAVVCSGGTTACDDACVDTGYDPANCGGCGTACTADEVCSAGSCGVSCVGGTTQCDGLCVDTNVDPGNCGGCGDDPNAGDNICAVGQVCDGNGACSLTCQDGLAKCADECVNLLTDVRYCSDTGSCGMGCGVGEVCSAGVCGVSCATGLTACGGSCVNTEYDPNHCSACTTPCDGTNATSTCVSGVCKPVCDAGYGNCDADPTDGCEVDLTTDVSNCGFCGNACTTGPCTNGHCPG